MQLLNQFEPVFRIILPLQTSFFEDYLGEGQEKCAPEIEEDPFEIEITDKCTEDQLKNLDKKYFF